MKWRDSDEQTRLAGKSASDYLDEEDNPHWNSEESGGYLSLIKMYLKRYSPILIGVLLFLIVVGFLKIVFSGGGVDEKRLSALEKKIQNLEENYGKFDSIDDKVTRIWEQAKSFESFKERFDRTEASMTLRMDHLAGNIDSVQKRLTDADSHSKVTRSVQQIENKTTEKSASSAVALRYHTVAPKDTLYGISLKYKIKLEDLLEMNRIAKNAILQPGQKLIVRR